MIFRIRYKLILAISSLILILFLLAAFLFIRENRKEMANDIYLNTLAFSRLTADEVVYNYDVYLEQNSFVYFNREIKALFEKNKDIGRIRVISYTGELLYDSVVDTDKRYEGPPRVVGDELLMEQVRSQNISLRTLLDAKNSVSNIYIATRDQVDEFVDKYEAPASGLMESQLIEFFVVPASERYSVVYDIDYGQMEQRLSDTRERIIYLAVFGIMLGVLLSFRMASSFTKPIGTLVAAGGEISKGNLKHRVEIKTNDEMGILSDSFNRMAADLEVSLQAKVYQERVVRELELASAIQKQIVPKVLPQVEGLDIAAGLVPAGEIGGDMYDFLTMNPERLLFYLGDVTGHGVPAGIVSSIANALFFGYAGVSDLKALMTEVNRVMKAKTMPNIFMTLCLLEWNKAMKKLCYVSAGHEQIVHFKAANKNVILEPAGGIAIGMLKDISPHLNVAEIQFEIGDYVVIYSDGIPECWRNAKENLGMDGLMSLVEQLGKTVNTAEEMKDGILNYLKSYSAGYPQMDDITLVVVKRV